MSGFCGWVRFAAEEGVQRRVLSDMAESLDPFGSSEPESSLEQDSALAVAREAGVTRVERAEDAIAVVDGNPYFEDAELAAQARERGAASALLQGYLQRGPRVLDDLRGGFALAVIRPSAGEALLAVDLIAGRHPLYYRRQDGCLIFSTHGDPIQRHPLGGSEIDAQAIFDYIYFFVVPGPRTARRDVHRLLPGQSLLFRAGATEIERHRSVEFVEDGRVPLGELEREFHEVLTECIRHSAEGPLPGCFLSGGTDSSTVAGMVRKVTGEPPRTYSVGFDVEGYDELRYARIAARRFDARHREYCVKPDDLIDLIPQIAKAYSEPMGNESAVAVYHCAKLAHDDGVRRMLGGDGGDELFAGNERYVKQRVFELYQRVPSWLRGRLIEPLVFGFPGGDSVPPLRKARSYIRQSNIPMPLRMQSYNHLERFGVENVIDAEFLARVDAEEPSALLAEAYGDSNARDMLNRMLALDWRITLADNDLPKVSRMCELAGVAAGYPLLDDRLVEFSARIPLRYKMKGLKLRWFWKHALRDFLPREILSKPKQGMGVPFGMWMKTHSGVREITLDSLSDLKGRRVVRADFIDELTRLHREVHAVYYGTMIWNLVQLEQWFKAHGDLAPARQ